MQPGLRNVIGLECILDRNLEVVADMTQSGPEACEVILGSISTETVQNETQDLRRKRQFGCHDGIQSPWPTMYEEQETQKWDGVQGSKFRQAMNPWHEALAPSRAI